MVLHKNEEFENIYYVDVFQKEIDSIFKNKKATGDRFSLWLNTQLNALDQQGLDVLINNRFFETLQGKGKNEDIYKIKNTQFKENPRILFTTFYEDETFIAIQLVAFEEKNTADYKRRIDTAIKRKKIIKKMLEE